MLPFLVYDDLFFKRFLKQKTAKYLKTVIDHWKFFTKTSLL